MVPSANPERYKYILYIQISRPKLGVSAIDIITPLTIDTANQNGNITLNDNFIMGGGCFVFFPLSEENLKERKKINKTNKKEKVVIQSKIKVEQN